MKEILCTCEFNLSSDHLTHHSVIVTDEEYYELKNSDKLIQNILPNRSDTDREKLITGMCEACQEIMY